MALLPQIGFLIAERSNGERVTNFDLPLFLRLYGNAGAVRRFSLCALTSLNSQWLVSNSEVRMLRG